jgi:hypothetical protein
MKLATSSTWTELLLLLIAFVSSQLVRAGPPGHHIHPSLPSTRPRPARTREL